MKLRLKFGRETKVKELDDACFVSSLNSLVCELFPELKCEFKLSLNKKDALEETKTLASQGIVSGDLVYVVTSDNEDTAKSVCKPHLLSKEWTDSVQQTSGVGSQGNFTQTVRTGESSGSSSFNRQKNIDVTSSSTSQLPKECLYSDENLGGQNQHTMSVPSAHGQEISEIDTQEQIANIAVEHVDHALVNRYLNEPMLCRESHGLVVPAMLSDVYQTAGITCSAEAMCTVLHVLMLETGYTTVNKKYCVPTSEQPVSQTNPDTGTLNTSSEDSDTSFPDREMPAGWREKPGQYSLTYTHVQSNSTEETPSFVVTCVTMATVMVVHGRQQGNQDNWSCHVNLNTKDFIRNTMDKGAGGCFKNLEKLSRVFKDSIALPMLQQYRAGLELPPLYGIFAISHEVKLKILGMLDVVSVLKMSETCKEFNHLCKDRYIWRQIYLKDFGNRNNNTLTQDWARLYRQEYKLRKERRRIWNRNQTPMFGPPVIPSFGLPPPGPFHPGILNGDHDLDPVPGPYDWRLMPNSQRNQASSSLFRPRFDPVGPLPDHNLLPMRGGGLRDRRGPFSGGFGGRRMF